MDRQIAFILAGACVALSFGAYLMTQSMGEYDLDKSARDQAARVEKMENGGEKPSLFASLLSKASTSMELARKQYMGQHLPKTPKGWKIEKTHHDQIVDFSTKYKLEMASSDRPGIRRFMAWGSTTTRRVTDVKYTKGDKVLFFRLVFDPRERDEPITGTHAWFFVGVGASKQELTIKNMAFSQRLYGDLDLINVAGLVSDNAAIGIFGNGSVADVEELMSGMDVAAFAAEGPTKKSGGGMVAVSSQPKEMKGLDLDFGADEAERPVKRAPKPSPKGNLMASLGEESDEPATEDSEAKAVKKDRKSRNLLGSLLQKAGVGGEEEKPLRAKRKKADGGSSFNRVGNFTSKCESGGGAKICRVGE